jgi:hypothetical protein
VLEPELVGSDVADSLSPAEPKQPAQCSLALPARQGDRPGRRVPPGLGETLLLVELSGDVVGDDVHGLPSNCIGTEGVPAILPAAAFHESTIRTP